MKPNVLSMPASPPADPARPARSILRAIRVIHPFPTLLNVVAVGGLAFVAAGGAPDAALLTRMLLVMLFAQSAIGAVNDICDRDLDAAAKPWKPIPAGAITLRSAAVLAAGCIAAAAALAATLGAAGFTLAMLGLACGLAYDVRLKRTAFSAPPFMVAIPVLPLWVWATLGAWDGVLWWLLPLGALIGLALHLANTIPDIDEDARHGVRGLAHRLGREGSMRVAWSSFAAALTLSAALAPSLSYDLRVYVPALAFGIACLALAAAATLTRHDAAASPVAFGALAIGAVVLAVGWLAAAT